MIVAASMLLVPIGILFLVPMPRWACFLVLVVSTILYTPLIFLACDGKFSQAALGIAAFVAILASFLAQLENGN